MARSVVDYQLGVCWTHACSIPSTDTHTKDEDVDVDRCDPVMSAFRFLQKKPFFEVDPVPKWVVDNGMPPGARHHLQVHALEFS